MQQIDLGSINSIQGMGINLLPFAPSQESAEFTEFSDTLDLSIEKSEKSQQEINSVNSYISESLDKIDKEFKNIEPTIENNIDMALVQSFAILNTVDSIISNVDNLNSVEDLKSQLEEKGVSEENIDKIIKKLNLETTQQDFSGIIASMVIPVTEEPNLEQSKTDVIIQQRASKTLSIATQQQNNNIMAEQINSGEEISDLNINKKQNIEVKTQNNQLEIETTEKNISLSESVGKADNSKLKLQELISQFKVNKNENETLDINPTKKAQIKEQSQDIQPNITETNTSKKLDQTIKTDVQPAATQEVLIKQKLGNNEKSTTEEVSEYKALQNKAQDNIKDSETKQPLESLSENTEQKHNKEFTLADKNISVNNKHESNQAQISNIEMAQKFDAMIQEKSEIQQNSNLDLYKIAQEANVQSQINIAIKQLKTTGDRQIKVKLHPEELGSVDIELNISNSTAKGLIIVESPEVAKHLAQNLKEAFQGFKGAGFELSEKDIEIKVDDNATNNKRKQHNSNTKQDNQSQEETILSYTNDDSLDIKV